MTNNKSMKELEADVKDKVIGTKKRPGVLRIAAASGDVWFKKIAGGAYQDKYIPDILVFCRLGGFAIELKGSQKKADKMMQAIREKSWHEMPGLGSRERGQCEEIYLIRKTGAIGFVTADPEEVIKRLDLWGHVAPLFAGGEK